MTDWQPVENGLPPEHVEVIVYAPDESQPVFTAQIIYEWSRSSAGICAMRDDYFGDPTPVVTHWMPLPDPPTLCEK